MRCPVCLNASTVPRVFEVDRFALSACGACDCLFLDPAPTVDELSHFYPAHYWWSVDFDPLRSLPLARSPSKGDSTPFRRFVDQFTKMLLLSPFEGDSASGSERRGSNILTSIEGLYRRFILRDHIAFITQAASALPPGRRPPQLLDVGCGTATLLGLLKTRGFRVLGMDSSKHAATLAKTQSGVDVVVGSHLRHAAFPSAAFDLVTLFHVIEHIPDPHDLLAEVRRILHPAGRLIVQVPNTESWQARLCGARWAGLDVPRHVINYSSRSIQRLLSSTGFRIRRTRHFNLRDNAPALASSLFRSLDPLRRRALSETAPLAWLKHAAYVSIVAAVYPFAIAEAIAGRGATVTLEAEKA
jgi:SAM-dependent methyltransferase